VPLGIRGAWKDLLGVKWETRGLFRPAKTGRGERCSILQKKRLKTVKKPLCKKRGRLACWKPGKPPQSGVSPATGEGEVVFLGSSGKTEVMRGFKLSVGAGSCYDL